MTAYLLTGSTGLPAFRIEKTRAALERGLTFAVDGLSARPVYFVDAAAALDEGELGSLGRLLDGGAALSPDAQGGGLADPVPPNDPAVIHFLVTPRPGTVSPWSSKATDIVRNCGHASVRRVERGVLWSLLPSPPQEWGPVHREAAGTAVAGGEPFVALYDRMTERLLPLAGPPAALAVPEDLFRETAPGPLVTIPLGDAPEDTLREADRRLGLALGGDEIRWLCERFGALGRGPTDAELMMFAQANSEHCRHKIFNAAWIVDGAPAGRSLFDMIRNTHAANPGRVISAYRDNAAVTETAPAAWFAPDPDTGVYARGAAEPAGLVVKVETHNHPTAVSPFPGAATGAGGEIRDEAATGRGAESRAGLTGFSVSHLHIPDFAQPWEREAHGPGDPAHVASALDIMLEGPIGAARFNNEFGRPALAGYFRTFEQPKAGAPGVWHGYRKPIMAAGGMGRIRVRHAAKTRPPPGAPILVLGGPAMLIGLGGGAASSAAAPGGGGGAAPESAPEHRRELDFASVQRDNAEMQRRAQEVVNACTRLGERNPILSIHDVGAGGLANAAPELVHAAGYGARLNLRAIPNADPGMSPMELWCNEAQERYVLAVAPDGGRELLEAICRRERCPVAVLGEVTGEPRLVLRDGPGGEPVVDVPLDLVLGGAPRLVREARRPEAARRASADDATPLSGIDAKEALERVLRLPCVADKTFLVTIGDRTVSGLVARDQMVGPWQVPVADCAVTAAGYDGYEGEAMAMGERAPLAVLDAAASARMAVGEALTNLASAGVDRLASVVLSANWMADAGADDDPLYEAVRAVGLELCPALGVPIPVGKDSLSMRTTWRGEDGGARTVAAPLSLVVSAFAPVADVRRALTPEPVRDDDGALLVFADLGLGRNRLGGSALAQVFPATDGAMRAFPSPYDAPPDVEEPEVLRGFFDALSDLLADGLALACHDRSDGGLAAALCEMAFAGRTGLRIDLTALGPEPLAALFCEELGVVVQVRADRAGEVLARLRAVPRLEAHVHVLGSTAADGRLRFEHGGATVLEADRVDLQRAWSETGYRMQALRDDPECAREAFDVLLDADDPGLGSSLTFRTQDRRAPRGGGERPAVAILREQGVNGHVELACAFDRAGFDAVDVHMTDLLEGRRTLDGFAGLAAGGGFSYGDVLGAGGGWAATVLHHERLREAFRAFFARPDTFTLGLCNGCQMLARLAALIPGADGWPPRFGPNRSGQFEARLAMCEVLPSPSIFFRGMAGSKLPVPVAHGEGRAEPPTADAACLRFVDNRHRPAERYPANPNGSPGGLTGFTSRDGRATILMPHPERAFRSVQLSWRPPAWGGEWDEDSPWMEMFRNARAWVDARGAKDAPIR